MRNQRGTSKILWLRKPISLYNFDAQEIDSTTTISIGAVMADETGLPKATVNKVIKDCLPENLKIAAEVRDIVADASLGS